MPTNSQFVLTGSYLRTSEDIFTGPGGYKFQRGADGPAFVSNKLNVAFDDSNLQKIDCVFMDKSTGAGFPYARYRSNRINNFEPTELPNVITVSKAGHFFNNADFSNQTFTKMAKNADWMNQANAFTSSSGIALEHSPDRGGYEATINSVNYFLIPKTQNSLGTNTHETHFYAQPTSDSSSKKFFVLAQGTGSITDTTSRWSNPTEPLEIVVGTDSGGSPIWQYKVQGIVRAEMVTGHSSSGFPWTYAWTDEWINVIFTPPVDLASDVAVGNWVLFHDGHGRSGSTFQAENLDFGSGIIPVTTTNTLVGNVDGGGNGEVTFTVAKTPTTGYLHVFKDYDPGGVAFWFLSFKSTSTLSGSNIFVRGVQSDTRTPNLSTVYHPFVNVPDNSLYSNTSHSQDALTNYYWTLDDVGVKNQSFGQFTWDFSNTEGDPLEFESRPFTDFNQTPDTVVWSATPLSGTSIGYKTDPGKIRQRKLFFGPNPDLNETHLTNTSETSTFRASGLAADNRYYWKVNLTNDAGTTESLVFSFTTSGTEYLTTSSPGTTAGSGYTPAPGDGEEETVEVLYVEPTSGYIGGERFELKRLISGEKAKVFDTSKGVMIGDLEEDFTNFTASTGNTFNKFASYGASRRALVKNVYFSDEFIRQSHINVPVTQDDDGLLNVISPDVRQLAVTQFNETAVGMTDLTDKTIKYLNYDANKNAHLLVEGGNAIAVYPPSGSIKESRSSVPSAALEPMFIVSGLEFNFIEESPVEFDFYDFNSGIMYSNTMNAKNMYDSSFNTNVVVSGENNQFATKTNFLTGDTNLVGHLSAEVHNSRYYIDVNSDGNHLLYNVYRNAKNYEPDSDIQSTGKLLKPFNSDPYFRSWNIENTSLTGWVTSGDSQTDSNRRLSAFVEEFRLQNKATADNKRKRANQFDLFGAVVMSGKSKIQTNGEILKPSQTYTFRVELDTQHLSGNGTSFFRSNGSKIISAPGITEWQYQVSTTDPNSSHLFLSGDHNDSQCILKSLSVSKGNKSRVAIRGKGVKNGNFTNWNHTDDSADNFYSAPTNWSVVATSGLVQRDEKALPDFNDVRPCISMAKSGFVEISNTNNTFNTLSAADKTYAILVKFPDHLPRAKTLSGSSQARDTDDERLGLIGKPNGFTEGEDHICIFPPGKTTVNHLVTDNPRVWWRGGSSAAGAGNIYDADQNFFINAREFDGQWKWLVFRKDRANTDKKFAMTNNVSGFKTESKNDTDININTFNPGVGASTITPYMQGRSSLTFSRYYEWNRSLTDGETEGIIKLNHIPSGALVGYKFENPYTEKITNTLSANARDGLLIREENVNGNKEEMDTFWSQNMKIKEPTGGVRMYNNGTGYTRISQDDAFISPSGFYDVSITTSDFASGTVSLSCGLAPIGTIQQQGTKRFKFNKVGTNAPSAMIIQLTSEGTSTPASGLGDVVINSVSITCLSGNAGTGDAGSNASLYDLAERVDGFYRYQTIPIHKSNLFSIRINNSRLNRDETLGEVEKENIRKSVTNVVKNIVDKITPVHTQLLGIEFTGE